MHLSSVKEYATRAGLSLSGAKSRVQRGRSQASLQSGACYTGHVPKRASRRPWCVVVPAAISLLAAVDMAACHDFGVGGGGGQGGDAGGDAGDDSAIHVKPDDAAGDSASGDSAPTTDAHPEGGCSGLVCGGQCVPNDVDNCGACGHSCLGGACDAGVCQPVTLAATPNSAYYIAIDTNNVYWTGSSSTGGGVYGCPKAGGCGAGTPLYAMDGHLVFGLAAPSPSSAYANDLYGSAVNSGVDNYFLQITKSPPGGTSILGSPYTPLDAAFDNAGSWVYIVDQDGPSSPPAGGLDRIKPDGSQFSRFLSGGLSPGADALMGIDGQNVYVADTYNNRVIYCPLSGSSCVMGTVMLVTAPNAAYSDGSNVWVAAGKYGSSTGTISKCPVSTNCGGSATTIAAGQGLPWAVVADASNVYWTNRSGGQVSRCAVGGCGGSPTVLATVAAPGPIVADATALYWADADGIKKLAK
jgi:hypothetical protein